jgi:hypothetical protein
MALWISQQYLKTLTPINANVDITEVTGHIETSQLIYTREQLGKLLYDDLDSKITLGTLSAIETELVDIIKQAIAYRSAEIAIPFLGIKVRNKGVVRLNDEFATPASVEELKYLRNELSNRAQYFEKRVQDFLCEFSTDFPLWLKSKDSNGNKQEIYPNMNNPMVDDIYTEDKDNWDLKRNRYFYGPNGAYPNRGY